MVKLRTEGEDQTENLLEVRRAGRFLARPSSATGPGGQGQAGGTLGKAQAPMKTSFHEFLPSLHAHSEIYYCRIHVSRKRRNSRVSHRAERNRVSTLIDR
jgi:hypothetical protein